MTGADPEILRDGWLLALNYAGAWWVGSCLTMAHHLPVVLYTKDVVKVGG